MALQDSDLFIVQRNQQSYKMPASELQSYQPVPEVGDGTITIIQPGTTNQQFTVNQFGDTTITLKNDNDDTIYTAGPGLTLSGNTFSVLASDDTIPVDSSGIKVIPDNLGIKSTVPVGSAPPTSPAPEQGDLFWDTDDGRMYIFINDGVTVAQPGAWVPASPL